MSLLDSRWGVANIFIVLLAGAANAQERAPLAEDGMIAAEAPADPAKKYLDLKKSKNRAIKTLADRYDDLIGVQEWVDVSGKFKTKAKYVEHDPELKWVKLTTAAGKEATIQLSKLNKASQAKVRQIAALQRKLDELAAAEKTDAAGTSEYGGADRDGRGEMSTGQREEPAREERGDAPRGGRFGSADARAGVTSGGSSFDSRFGGPGRFGQVGQPRVEPGKVILEWPKNHGGFFGFAFAPDGQLLAGGTGVVTTDAGSGPKVAGGGEVLLWNVSTGELVRTLGDHGAKVEWLAYSGDGQWLASASKTSGVIKVWDTQSGSEKHAFETPGGKILAVAFSADGKTVVAVGEKSRPSGKSTIQEGGELVAWDAASGAKTWNVPDSGVQQISISPDGQTLATYSVKLSEAKPDDQGNARWKHVEPRITFFDIASGKENAKFDLKAPLSVKFLTFLPGGDRLVLLDTRGLSQLDVRTGQMDNPIPWDKQRFAFSSAALSADGQVVGRAWSNWVELVDVATGKVQGLRKVEFPNHWFNVCFSADLKRIACSQQGAAIIDIADLEPAADASSP